MNLIVAVDKAWGIGSDGNLLYSIPEDMKFFRKTTLNNVVVMGRTTLESLPDSKPLPKRTNIVLSANTDYQVEGAVVCHNIEEVLKEIKQYDTEDVFVIGGKTVYEQLLSYCQKAYVTKINEVRPSDCKLINLDELSDWRCIYISEIHNHEGIEYTFNTYENSKCKEF